MTNAYYVTVLRNVLIFHQVTLGCINVKKVKHNDLRRHPTIGDNVTIYPGAIILGGKTKIGKGAVFSATSTPSYVFR